MAEFKIRGLVRRLDKAEVELREIKAGAWYGEDEERAQRMRALRRWIKQDGAELRSLLGSNNQNLGANNQMAKEKS